MAPFFFIHIHMATPTTVDTDTELSAVNSILGAIGQSPVTSLGPADNGTGETINFANPETGFIYNILTEVNKDVQNESWVFNTEFHVKLPPDSNKNILIPTNVLRYDLHEDNVYRTKNLIRKSGKLWDTIKQTYEFDTVLYLDITYLYPFTDLPSAFQRYIISRSSVRAATQLVSNPQLVQLLQSQEALARATCIEYECQQGDHSYMGFPDESTYRTYQPYSVLYR